MKARYHASKTVGVNGFVCIHTFIIYIHILNPLGAILFVSMYSESLHCRADAMYPSVIFVQVKTSSHYLHDSRIHMHM